MYLKKKEQLCCSRVIVKPCLWAFQWHKGIFVPLTEEVNLINSGKLLGEQKVL